MFDIGFWELGLLFLVGLLVLGPERLPRVARTAGMYVRKARQTWSGMRREIEREMAAEDLRNEMREQRQVLDELKGVGEEVDQAVRTQSTAGAPPSGLKAGIRTASKAPRDAANLSAQGPSAPDSSEPDPSEPDQPPPDQRGQHG